MRAMDPPSGKSRADCVLLLLILLLLLFLLLLLLLRVDQLQVAGDEEGLLVLARVVGLGLEQDVANELLWR